MKKKALKTIGWREWVTLVNFNGKAIKVKVDSGARTSSLHATHIKTYMEDEEQWVRFSLHPNQRSSKEAIECSAKVLEFRKVKSSNGQTELRPVILTELELLGEQWQAELTLTNRAKMGFRMLLGREAVRGKFLIDTNKSFYGINKNSEEKR